VVPLQRQPSILIVQFREAAGLFYGSALLLSIEVMAAYKARKRSAVNVKNRCDGAMGDVLAQQFLKEPLLKWWCHHTRLVTDMASIRSPSWLSRTFDESEVRATTGGLLSLSPVPPIGPVS